MKRSVSTSRRRLSDCGKHCRSGLADESEPWGGRRSPNPELRCSQQSRAKRQSSRSRKKRLLKLSELVT